MNKVITLIDVQEKLFSQIYKKDELLENLAILLKGANILDIAVIWMEQLPNKLGPTVSDLKQLMGNRSPIIKNVFSCGASKEYNSFLAKTNADEIILCGIETHVCIYQTARDLLSSGKKVQIVADAVSSRKELNHNIGLQKMCAEGASLTSVELFLFEIQKIAKGDQFRSLLNLIK